MKYILLLLLFISPCLADVYLYGTGLSLRGSSMSNLVGSTYESQSSFMYYVANNEAVITGYTGNANLIMPPTIAGYPLTAVGSNTFYLTGVITNIVLGENVKDLMYFSLFGITNLETITFNNLIHNIGPYSMGRIGKLRNLVIPDIVTNCDIQAFTQSPVLTNIVFGTGITYLSANILQSATSLVSVVMSTNLTVIYGSAFSGCSSLKNFVMPNSVTYLDNAGSQFSNCQITNLVFSSSLTNLPTTMTTDNIALQRVTIPASIKNVSTRVFLRNTGLQEAYFEGDAPSLYSGTTSNMFASCTNIVYYHAASNGWGATFHGRPTATW